MLTESEERELELLRDYQSDNTRWLSQYEFDRIKELVDKKYPIYPKECANCTGHEESECCGELIILHDICSLCGEHTECKCENCIDKEEVE